MSNNEYNCDCNIIHKDTVNQTKERMLDDITLTKVADFFKILGDPTRTKILCALDNN